MIAQHWWVDADRQNWPVAPYNADVELMTMGMCRSLNLVAHIETVEQHPQLHIVVGCDVIMVYVDIADREVPRGHRGPFHNVGQVVEEVVVADHLQARTI
jgi:hypothetical protein